MPKHAFDLSNLSWTLRGMLPDGWRLGLSMEQGLTIRDDVPAVPAKVPGSVQAALRDAGVLPDWRIGLNTRRCEWVEHRHWLYQTVLPAEWCDKPGRMILHARGLDYQGHIILHGRIVGDFKGSFVPHQFDLTDALQPGDNKLEIVFTSVPPFLGLGYTSKITAWKERFNYTWDWTPRLVQIGIWGTTASPAQPTHRLSTAKLVSSLQRWPCASSGGGLTRVAQNQAPTGLHPTAQGKSAKRTPPWVSSPQMRSALNGQHPDLSKK